MPPLVEPIVRLVVAVVLGAILGAEREYRQKAAGLRTNALIALGSALFTIMSIEVVPEGAGDPSRIAAQIVTGIGFLGGGAILRTGMSVKGLTTAATIWVVAAVGVAAGAGKYMHAVIATGIAFIVLTALAPVEGLIEPDENEKGNES